MAGELPNNLGVLDALVELVLSGNGIMETIPESLGRCKQLQV
jgi:hypothetical protein